MKNDKLDLLACRCTYWNEKIYCLARDFNLLFSVGLQDGKIELVDVVPEGDLLTTYLFGFMSTYNDKLIITPDKTKKIWIYDLVSKCWNSLATKEYEHYWANGGIQQIYTYNDKLFLVGGDYPAILCLDLQHNSCDYIEEPYKEIMARHPDRDYLYFRSYGVKLENNLYLASCLDNFVLKFDMETCEHCWIKVGDDNYTYSGITWDGNNFWLSPRLNGDIIKWDGSDKTKILPLSRELTEADQIHSWEACYDGSKIVLPNASYPKSILIDPQNDHFEFSEQQYPLFTRLDNGMVVSQSTNGDLSVTTENSSPKNYHIAIETKQLKQFYKKRNLPIFKEQMLYHEVPNHPLLSLEGFLAFAGSEAGDRSTPDNGSIGKKIWEQIRP